MSAPEYTFEHRGLGYAAIWDAAGVEVTFSQLKRERGTLAAEVRATAIMPGIAPRTDGFLTSSRMNLSAQRTRQSLANFLGKRTNGANVPWDEIIERSFLAVIEADREGGIFEAVDFGAAPKELTYLLHGFARKGVVTWLYGPGGAGKTTLLTALAMSVAAGREIVPGIAPAAKGTVLYLDWETDRDDFGYRARQIADGTGIAGAAVTYRRCERPMVEEIDVVARAVEERGVILVIVDSAGLALGSGDYSDRSEPVKAFFRATRTLHTTVIVGDHIAKAQRGKDDATPIDSIYKENLARASWQMRKLYEEGDIMRVSLHLKKANDGSKRAPIGLQMNFAGQQVVFTSQDAAGDDLPGSVTERIYSALDGLEEGMTQSVLATLIDASEVTTKQTLHRLRRKGHVAHDRHMRWTLTTAGIMAAGGVVPEGGVSSTVSSPSEASV